MPTLVKMRDVLEHIDEYALDRGRHTDVSRQRLQVNTWGNGIYRWLDIDFNADTAIAAAIKLFQSVSEAGK